MAIALDVADLGGYISESGTFAFTTTSDVASGGFIVVQTQFYHSTNTLTSVTGGGLTWTIDKQANFTGDSSQNLAIISAQAPSGLASGATITLVHSGLPAVATAKASSFTGVKTSAVVDGTPTGPTTDDLTWVTDSYALTAGSLMVACCAAAGTATNTATAGTELWDAAMGSYSVAAQYRIEASAGSYTLGGTWSGAVNTRNIAVAYLAAAGTTNATIALTGTRATGTAGVVAPPRPRPAHPYSEVNLRM